MLKTTSKIKKVQLSISYHSPTSFAINKSLFWCIRYILMMSNHSKTQTTNLWNPSRFKYHLEKITDSNSRVAKLIPPSSQSTTIPSIKKIQGNKPFCGKWPINTSFFKNQNDQFIGHLSIKVIFFWSLGIRTPIYLIKSQIESYL